MSSLTDDDDDMKALRAYCLKIETIQRAKKSCDPRSDKSAWFYKQKPLNAIDRNDSASWKLQASLFKMHFNRNGKKDDEMFGDAASTSHKQIETKTPNNKPLQVPKQVRITIPGPDFTPGTVTRCPLPERNEKLAAARARAAKRAGKKQLEEANKEYQWAYQENLMELEYGPRCNCNRYPWQHELHPAGTMKQNPERDQQSGDVEMAEPMERKHELRAYAGFRIQDIAITHRALMAIAV